MTDFDALARLDEAGAIPGASEEQRRVLATLSEPEVSVLTSIKQRLEAAGPDVAAHIKGDGGIFH
jgi:hypothetical protein